MGVGELIRNGDLWVAVPIAVLAGLLSFASPCVLPLVPGYLAYVGGFSGEVTDDAAEARRARRRLVLGVALFVLGFTLIFVVIMALAGTVGSWLLEWENLITRLLGVVVIAMGLVFMGSFTLAQKTVRARWQPKTGLLGAPLLGAVFAIGWTPCLGPTLLAIFSLSVQGGSPMRGTVLGFFYCLGLGIPFLLVALGFGWVTSSVKFLRKHIRVVNVIGGLMLVIIGVLMVTGVWSNMMFALQAVMRSYVAPL
ncbi:cytochrome c biogenesis CcdA family protein [Lysinibacter sp. HNR]|uniref:cytochrome c biogenesis CcdA family protein n=1 Tax=Lysinibacter sp. HNR TaxID=3031408 RepID=UPI00243523F1|nr:cytochrome c biogenesis CcdA family protein [Lysinibacter sp. HNR]WGD37795.1 cytochrome c biogenesis CcdA family protein [Lysinibacter sp. HNR]